MHWCTTQTRSRASASGGRNMGRDAGGVDDHVHRLAVIGELAASILHQVNGPLTYMLLSLERLERAVTDPESKEALHAARQGAEIVRELSRDVTLLA
jgi:signal transduction histidine kinase